jgi:hypothetical protein
MPSPRPSPHARDPENLTGRTWIPSIYDVNLQTFQTPGFINSSLRGHSLARTLYGYDETPGSNINANCIPFCDIGHLGGTNASVINYLYFASDGVVYDPERIGTRASPSAGFAANTYAPGNAPYTYPDLNNVYLAVFAGRPGCARFQPGPGTVGD